MYLMEMTCGEQRTQVYATPYMATAITAAFLMNVPIDEIYLNNVQVEPALIIHMVANGGKEREICPWTPENAHIVR